jgi:hypothetical protein
LTYMRTAAPWAPGGYPYEGIAYANPDAVTQIANGLSTPTYDADGNVVRFTTGSDDRDLRIASPHDK